MAIRNRLHISKLDDFKNFLIQKGYEIKEIKDCWEVLRAKKDKDTIIIYSKYEAKEHLSVQDKDRKILKEFLKIKEE